jgi:hypothetical protein
MKKLLLLTILVAAVSSTVVTLSGWERGVRLQPDLKPITTGAFHQVFLNPSFRSTIL